MATISQEAYNRVMAQAAKEGKADRVASVAQSKGISVAPTSAPTVRTPIDQNVGVNTGNVT